jgi:hypothetical protein
LTEGINQVRPASLLRASASDWQNARGSARCAPDRRDSSPSRRSFPSGRVRKGPHRHERREESAITKVKAPPSGRFVPAGSSNLPGSRSQALDKKADSSSISEVQGLRTPTKRSRFTPRASPRPRALQAEMEAFCGKEFAPEPRALAQGIAVAMSKPKTAGNGANSCRPVQRA